jgi:hypothetical protein
MSLAVLVLVVRGVASQTRTPIDASTSKPMRPAIFMRRLLVVAFVWVVAQWRTVVDNVAAEKWTVPRIDRKHREMQARLGALTTQFTLYLLVTTHRHATISHPRAPK